MKRLCLAVAALCLIFMHAGCSDDDETPGAGFYPKIRSGMFMNLNDPQNAYRTSVFILGDQAGVSIRAEDKDLDMKVLYLTIFNQDDLETPYAGPDDVLLPAQTDKIMSYNNLFSITIEEPAGTYVMELQIEDERGNMSDIFTLGFRVE